MFEIYTNTFLPISWTSFINSTVSMFESMIEGIKRLKEECQLSLSPLKWASLVHDYWTSKANDAALGSSMRFISKDLETMTIAMILMKNNVNHSSEEQAKNLKEKYLT